MGIAEASSTLMVAKLSSLLLTCLWSQTSRWTLLWAGWNQASWAWDLLAKTAQCFRLSKKQRDSSKERPTSWVACNPLATRLSNSELGSWARLPLSMRTKTGKGMTRARLMDRFSMTMKGLAKMTKISLSLALTKSLHVIKITGKGTTSITS